MANEGFVKHLASSDQPTEELASGKFPVSDFFSKQPKRLAEVLTYYPQYNTYKVKPHGVSGNSKIGAGTPFVVPRKVENPNVTAPLENGTMVILDYAAGIGPYIDGCVNVAASKDVVENSTKPAPTLTQKGADFAPGDKTGADAGYWRYPGMPADALEGDWAAVTPSGNYIAALLGKECTMYGSQMAQISVFGASGIARIICDQLELWNSMGKLSMVNDGGRGKFSFKLAADQLTEFGADNENWTFHLDIGDEGDFFDMRMTRPDGSLLSRLYFSSDGRVEIMGINGVHFTNAGNSPRFDTDGGDVHRKIGGQLKEVVEGPISQKTSGKRVVQVSEDDRTTVGHNQSTSINNHQIHSVGGNVQHTVTGGSAAEANPTNVAVFMKVLNGSYTLDIGNSLDGASPGAMAGYNLFVHNGEITIGEDPFGTPATKAVVSLNTLQQNSVVLGGNPTSAFQHACIAEPLLQMLNTLLGLLESHQHNTIVGPTNSLVAPGVFSALSTSLPKAQSVRVLIGL